MNMIEDKNSPGAGAAQDVAWLEIVRRKTLALRFGVVQIIVHESRVVQIEQTEKIRLAPLPLRGAGEAT